MPRRITAEERNSTAYQKHLDDDEKFRKHDAEMTEKYGKSGNFNDYEIAEAEDKAKKHKKKSPLDLLTEAREDKLISKKEYDLLKDESPSKIKARLKALEVQDLSDDEEIEEYKPDLTKYIPVKKSKKEKVVKEKLKPVALKLIGHELNTRTRKEKMSPEKKRDIYDFIMKFD